MAYLTSPTEVQLGPQGRLVIPAQLRRLLGFEPGDRLVARLEDGRLILEKREAIRRRLKDRFVRLPAGKSLASELLAERRREAEREEGR
ncbi:MAG: AbrB/MazE/SpoVT family DNA-binding domain-containing protein [Gammaproteobacteria bacterium]